ncbi:amidophosphoribosyltransferase [Ahniella affigens]|uniref:Amidophosphoribosyltransferase n=1 Tax=Ahniella affigens TaxID=2021234 RepID=A0A2P1PPW0_9GAMM|nr:amidophosphoribosyltransferase [Ahniella affigens]
MPGDRALCDGCTADLPRLGPACPICALPTPSSQVCGRCLKKPPEFDQLVAPLRYVWPNSQLVSRLKFHAQLAVLRAVAPLLAEVSVDPEWADTSACVIVPVPLARKRLAHRGYNQAQLLAEAWQREAGGRLRHGLTRVRETAAQVGQSRLARMRNVRHAFVADPVIVREQDIVLVDDVVTTAATVRACTRALSQAGARRVRVLALARALEPGADR